MAGGYLWSPKRNANGEGGVYRRADGRWEGKFFVDTPDGKWYITVHAYENGYRTLGRQLLLLPIEWTQDHWFRIANGITAAAEAA